VSTEGATIDRHQTLVEADAARHSRLGVVVLGVGSQVNGSEAAAIATHADSGVVYADNFDHLLDTNVDFTDLIVDKICGMCACIRCCNTHKSFKRHFSNHTYGDYTFS